MAGAEAAGADRGAGGVVDQVRRVLRPARRLRAPSGDDAPRRGPRRRAGPRGRLVGGAASAGRWSLTETAQGFDFTGADELWLDYVADSGDGFDATTTIASVAARDTLTLPTRQATVPTRVHETRAGAVLVLGGDQAYPFATMEEYRNRLVGPFRSVLPWTWRPRWLFAIPGNHDWYDGLASFVKQFCQGRWIGGWRSTQTRSYFALALPHNWHLWAVDVALGTDIDTGQLDYFEERARALQPGAQIVLCSAKPTWTDHASRRSHRSRRARVLRAHGDRRSRCAAADPLRRLAPLRPLRLRRRREQDHCGGWWRVPRTHPPPGHPRPPPIPGPVPGPDRPSPLSSSSSDRCSRARTSPVGSAGASSGRSTATAASSWSPRRPMPWWRWPSRLNGSSTSAGGLQTVAALLPVTLVGLLVFAGLYAFTAGAQVSRRRKRAAAALHTVLHVAVVVGVVDLLLQLSGVAAGDPWMRAVLGGAVGALLGPLVVAVYLWIADHAQINSNELYAGCANEAYKNFLRLHIDRTGLTVYPIGRAAPDWLDVRLGHAHRGPERSEGAWRLGWPAVVPAQERDRARADREAHPHTATAPLHRSAHTHYSTNLIAGTPKVCRVGAAQYGDFVTQYRNLDVVGARKRHA